MKSICFYNINSTFRVIFSILVTFGFVRFTSAQSIFKVDSIHVDDYFSIVSSPFIGDSILISPGPGQKFLLISPNGNISERKCLIRNIKGDCSSSQFCTATPTQALKEKKSLRVAYYDSLFLATDMQNTDLNIISRDFNKTNAVSFPIPLTHDRFVSYHNYFSLEPFQLIPEKVYCLLRWTHIKGDSTFPQKPLPLLLKFQLPNGFNRFNDSLNVLPRIEEVNFLKLSKRLKKNWTLNYFYDLLSSFSVSSKTNLLYVCDGTPAIEVISTISDKRVKRFRFGTGETHFNEKEWKGISSFQMNVAQLLSKHQISNLNLTPDGKYLAFLLIDPMNPDTLKSIISSGKINNNSDFDYYSSQRTSSIYIVEAKNGRLLQTHKLNFVPFYIGDFSQSYKLVVWHPWKRKDHFASVFQFNPKE